jgi:ferredoxin
VSLNFDLGSCVRSSSKVSECVKCVEICPVDTINISDTNLPAFIPSACIDCGACVGICPTESFSLDQFSIIEFFFSFLQSEDKIVSCKKNIPCISWLSVETLISLALANEKLVELDLSHCQTCEIGGKLFDKIISNIQETNFILSSFCDKSLKESYILEVMDLAEEKQVDLEVSSRRSFLSNLSLKGTIKNKREFDELVQQDELKEFNIDKSNISKIKEKNITDKRKLLFSTLRKQEKPSKYEVLPQEELSFISQKYIDDSCTNCQICYRVCPSGALSSDSKFSVINFDAKICLKCHLCHDVCESDSIHIQAGFENSEFFEPRERTLVKFNIKRCDECGNNFTYFEGERVCPRCFVEEDEAITLHQNAKSFNF